MLAADDRRLAAADTLGELWTGSPPKNRCPTIDALRPAGANRGQPGETLRAELAAADPEGDPLDVRWVLQADPQSLSVGGDAEAAGETFPDAIVNASPTAADVKLPAGGGGYRLFAWVTDDHGGAAVANVPLYVDAPIVVAPARAATLPLVVYDEADRSDPPFVPTGWMGNAKGLKVESDSTDAPARGPHLYEGRLLARRRLGRRRVAESAERLGRSRRRLERHGRKTPEVLGPRRPEAKSSALNSACSAKAKSSPIPGAANSRRSSWPPSGANTSCRSTGSI